MGDDTTILDALISGRTAESFLNTSSKNKLIVDNHINCQQTVQFMMTFIQCGTPFLATISVNFNTDKDHTRVFNIVDMTPA